ncbi:hypothetical protein QTP70_033021 [Hemibagrus guttatus]|uniref:ribonuclease H n=1 Tax=Hemibagrus guttatus TaxID=175788 RepID=A0AAE0QCT5_9TELE|nr:hypothetical protein QTP70_033021 [Hemibagrus guttatus]
MDPATSASGGPPLQYTSPITDPAELHEIIVRQGVVIRSYQDQVEVLHDQLCSASTAAPRDAPLTRGESPRLAMPEKFDGSADRCRGFLRQCEVFFSHQPGMYHEEGTKCSFLLSLLSCRALEWVSAVWDADPQVRSSFSYFVGMIREIFEHPAGGKDISVQLMELRQGSEAAADYAIRFRTRASQSGWNDAALWAMFHAALNPEQTELACHMEATSLSQFMATAIWLDNLRCQHRARTSVSAAARPHMHMDYPDEAVLQLQVLWSPEFSVPKEAFIYPALIDSGTAVNLIDRALVEELGIPTSPCVPSLRITAIDSQPIGEGYLKCQTELLGFQPYADFWRVFSEERAARLPAHQAWDCAIDLLPNTSLPKGRIYPLSLPESKAMEDYIEGALAVGHIRPSMSPAAAGFFFVGKKDGGLRPCIDYRGLNAITIRYPYPLPLVPAVLEQLRGAGLFTKLDLRSAYNLVRIREGEKWKTALHTTHGHYEYCVIPFGLTNAPTVFQALINGVFQDLLGRGVIAYINNILVYSASMEDHVRQVREVLARLQRHYLYVKLEKCEVHRATVTFLG